MLPDAEVERAHKHQVERLNKEMQLHARIQDFFFFFFFWGGGNFEIMQAKHWYVMMTSSGVMSINVWGGGGRQTNPQPPEPQGFEAFYNGKIIIQGPSYAGLPLSRVGTSRCGELARSYGKPFFY